MINRYKTRFTSVKHNFLLFIMILFMILLYQFYDIQINDYEKYKTRGSHNSLRKITNTAPRGIIYDRNNQPLVDNRPIYSLSLIPFDARQNFNFSLFHEITGLDSNSLSTIINKHSNKLSKFRPIILKNNIGFVQRSIIEEYKLEFPGIRFTSFPARTYPSEGSLSHVLGYLRKITRNIFEDGSNRNNYRIDDVFGYSGIEKVYENLLRGNDGVEFHMVDIYGIDHGLLKTVEDYPVLAGNSIQLSIDISMQRLAEELLTGNKGAIISMNPNSGDIFTLASAPDFNLDSFIGPIPPKKWNELSNNKTNPLLNRAIQGLYPPGSILKLILAAYALENKIIDDNWHIDCNGSIKYGDRIFKCWNEKGHGKINLLNSIKYSCNIFYYNLIQKIKFKDWTNIVETFGLGNKTGIDLPNEKIGIVPSREYMNNRYGRWGWGRGSLLNFAIGQGDLLATPIQVLQIINLIATEGKRYTPSLKIHRSHQFKKVNLSSKTWQLLKSSIYQAVNAEYGTGRKAKLGISNAKIYGKTSTAQNPHGENHSGFAGYIKLDNNEIMSLVVIIENGGKGSGIATQIANKLFKYFSEYYQ